MSIQQHLLPLGPTARRFHVPVSWLRNEAMAGRIPHLRAGKALLFDPEAVQQELLRRAKTAPGDCNDAVST